MSHAAVVKSASVLVAGFGILPDRAR